MGPHTCQTSALPLSFTLAQPYVLLVLAMFLMWIVNPFNYGSSIAEPYLPPCSVAFCFLSSAPPTYTRTPLLTTSSLGIVL